MNTKRYILIIGPFPQPITGLNLANFTVFSILKDSPDFVVDQIDLEINRGLDQSIGKFKWYKLKILFAYFKSYKVFKCHSIYCTIGQTFFGILKYAPFIFLARTANKKVVVHLHGNGLLDSFHDFTILEKRIASFVLKSVDEAIVLSSSMRKNFSSFIDDAKIKVCHNFITEEFQEERFETTSEGKIKVLFLSNLLPAKGIITFIDAIKQLDGNKFHVKIAGTVTQDFPEVTDLIREIAHCEYVGKVQGKEKVELYKWADVFCMPTQNSSEGQPLVILEALASGCYIIASNVVGISDIIDERNGKLIWPMEPIALKNSLSNLLDNKSLITRVKQYNLEYAKSFSYDAFSTRIKGLLS